MRVYVLVSPPIDGGLYQVGAGMSFANAHKLGESEGKDIVEIFTDEEHANLVAGCPECIGVGPDDLYQRFPVIARQVLVVDTEYGGISIEAWEAAGALRPAQLRSSMRLAGEE